MPQSAKIVKIIGGFRVSQIVDVSLTYSVRLLGSPSNIRYVIQNVTYGYNDVLTLASGDYPYVADVPNNTDYTPVTGTLSVIGGDRSLEVNLRKATHIVTFHATDNIPDVEISINNSILGNTNISGNLVALVEVGNYVVTGKKAGYFPSAGNLTVAAVDTNYEVVLVVSPSSDGIASFTSNPNATLYINGVLSGTTPVQIRETPDTQYTYRLEAAGYNAMYGTFAVETGKVSEIAVSLQKIATTGTIHFTSVNGAVEILNGAALIGTAPCTIELSPGTYNLLGRKTGYSSSTFAITIGAGQALNYTVTLLPLNNFLAYGTLVEYYCQGYDRYVRKNDGVGGTYTELVELNSSVCNYPVNAKVYITCNSAYYTAFLYSNGVLITTREISLFSTPADEYYYLPVGSYTVNIVPFSGTGLSDFGENAIDFVVNKPTDTLSLTVPLQTWSTKYSKATMIFTVTEGGVNPFGTSKGYAGFKIAGASIQGYLTATQLINAPFGGNISFTVDSQSSGRINLSGSNSNVNWSWRPDASFRNLAFVNSSSVSKIIQKQGSSAGYPVGSSEYYWQTEFLLFSGSGILTVELDISISYQVLG